MLFRSASEVHHLTKTGTNTTLNSGGTAAKLPQNYPAFPVFQTGAGGQDGGAVVDGSLSVLHNTSFTVNSLLQKIYNTGTTGYWDLSTSQPSSNNIETDNDSGSSSSDVWIKDQGSSKTYPPPTTSPYAYTPNGSHFWTATILLQSSTLRHIHVVSGLDQLILQGQTNASKYSSSASLPPVIIYVEQEIRDIRLDGECSRPIILALGPGTGQTC